MSTTFEVPPLEALIHEQAAVQEDKFQGRLIENYNRLLFPGQHWARPRSSAISDMVQPWCLSGRASLENLFEGLYDAYRRPINWTDMGAGRALPMRQLATDSITREQLRSTAVDLFDYDLDGLDADELDTIESWNPGITHERTKPRLITANAETVALPEPADVITSVMLMPYLNNPLAAISNWYNQLAADGLLFVTASEWASDIRYQREPGHPDRKQTPTKHLLEALGAAGIRHAATNEVDWRNGLRAKLDPRRFCILAIQKTAHTQLRVNTNVANVWQNAQHFKAVSYEDPATARLPAIEVIPT